MKVSGKVIAISIFVIVFGLIGISQLAGIWKTKTEKVPDVIQEGEYAGLPDPNDIKGSYTFEDVAKNFNIPKEDLSKAFGVDVKKFSTFKCKDVKSNFEDLDAEIGVSSVRLFVAMYKGIDVDVSEDAYLPKSAADVIMQNGKPTEKQIEYLKTHTVETTK